MRIIYYECENSACGLRFPEFREGLPRERCPICRGRVRIAMAMDHPPLEAKPSSGMEEKPVMEGMLDNIRSDLNVGSIFRSSDGIGIGRLYLCGITTTPDSATLQKTSLGAETSVAWERANNGVMKAMQLRCSGYCLWGLEATTNGESLYELGAKIPEKPLVLVVGNEVCGVDPKIIEQCERIVYIPMVGKKRSYNVAIAFGIAASYLRYCQISSQGSESRLPNTKLTP
jgi:23S rRNA (guanosine2251-2'-O)-methyltransferase